MADIQLPKAAGESTAKHACRYIIHRVMADPNFAHYMLNTQSLAQCISAIAKSAGDEQMIRDRIEAAVKKPTHEAETVALRKRIRELERENDLPENVKMLRKQIDELNRTITMKDEVLEDERSHHETVLKSFEKIEQLIHFAKYGFGEADIDAIGSVIEEVIN